MKITIPYRRGRRLLFAACHLAIFLITLHTAWRAFWFGGASLALLFPCLVVLAVSGYFLFHIISRFFRKTGCFSITADGIENAACVCLCWIVRLPVAVRLIPWGCIREFKLDFGGNAQKVLLIPKEEDAFPKGYPNAALSIFRREMDAGRPGVDFGSAGAAYDPKELYRLLSEKLEEYSRNGMRW